jgi:small-conductance mechanosensitive channel
MIATGAAFIVAVKSTDGLLIALFWAFPLYVIVLLIEFMVKVVSKKKGAAHKLAEENAKNEMSHELLANRSFSSQLPSAERVLFTPVLIISFLYPLCRRYSLFKAKKRGLPWSLL